VKRIESNEYFDAVQAYFAEHRVPERVYMFLLGTVRKEDYKISDDLLYRSIDTLETTENCLRFGTGTECVLVLCS
jgi:hypothetical protein